MNKIIPLLFLLSFVVACDESQDPNATPMIEDIGQYCLDNKVAADDCAASGEGAASCVAFQEYDAYTHYAWSAYKECVISTCAREAESNPDLGEIGIDAALDICVEDELSEGMGLNARCANSLILCNGLAEASEYWSD